MLWLRRSQDRKNTGLLSHAIGLRVSRQRLAVSRNENVRIWRPSWRSPVGSPQHQAQLVCLFGLDPSFDSVTRTTMNEQGEVLVDVNAIGTWRIIIGLVLFHVARDEISLSPWRLNGRGMASP